MLSCRRLMQRCDVVRSMTLQSRLAMQRSRSSNEAAMRAFSATPTVFSSPELGQEQVGSVTPIPMDAANFGSFFETASDKAAAGIVETADAVALGTPLLDLGYSPTDLAIRLFDSIHSLTGLPWWASVVATTVVLRTALLPVSVKSMINAGNMSLAKPELDKVFQSTRTEPHLARQNQAKMKAIMKKYNCKPLQFFLPFAQFPVFIGSFFGIQKMAEHYPEFKSGGLSWFTDLSAADPIIALPIISSVLMFATLESTPMQGMGKDTAQTMKNVMRILSVATIPLTMHLPAGVFIYWISSNFYSLAQTLAFKVPGVKSSLGIPVPLEQKVDVSSPFQKVLDSLRPAKVEEAKFVETFTQEDLREKKAPILSKPSKKKREIKARR